MRTRLIHTTPPTVLRVAESDTPHHPISHVLYLYPSIPSIPTRIALTSRLAEKNHDHLMTFSFARAHALLLFLLVYTLSYSLHIFRTLRLRLCLHFAFSGRNLSRSSSSRPVSFSFSSRLGSGRTHRPFMEGTYCYYHRHRNDIIEPSLASRVPRLAARIHLASRSRTMYTPSPVSRARCQTQALTHSAARASVFPSSPVSRFPLPHSISPPFRRGPPDNRPPPHPMISGSHNHRTRPLAARSSARPFLGTRMPEPGRRSRSIDPVAPFPPSLHRPARSVSDWPIAHTRTRTTPGTGTDTGHGYDHTPTRTRPRTCVHTHAIRYIRCRCRFRPFRLTDRPTDW